MANDKISLEDMKGIKDSFDSIKNDLDSGNHLPIGGNNYKNYNGDGDLVDDINSGKEKVENAINKVDDISKNVQALDKLDKAAGGKGLKNGAEGLKNLAAGGDKTKAALNTVKDNLKNGAKEASKASSGGSGGNNAADASKNAVEKAAENMKKAADQAKLAAKMAAKIAAQDYVGAAVDAIKNPAAFAALLKKILIIIFAVITIIVCIVMIPIFLIACLFFWLLPGATTNSASKENPDIAVKDMSDGEKDVLKDGDGITKEDMDKDMEYTIDMQYEQIYNVVYDKCKEIFSSKEQEFKNAITNSKKTHNKYEQKKASVKRDYGSNLVKVNFDNLSGDQKSAYKVYSDVKQQWLELDNHGFSPELESFNEQASLKSFYDHADLDVIADDIAYIMACYTVANGDCAPLSGNGDSEPSETIGYRDEFKKACEDNKVTENLFKLTTTEDHSSRKRTFDNLTYQKKNWNAFLTADEIFAVKDNISGYSDTKYPKNKYFLNISKYIASVNPNDISSYDVNTEDATKDGYPNEYTGGSRGEAFSANSASNGYGGLQSGYLLRMGANVNLKNDSYKFHIGTLTSSETNSYGGYEDIGAHTSFSLGYKNIYAQNLTTRYDKTSYNTSDFKDWLNNNKVLNNYSIVNKATLDTYGNKSNTRNYTTSANTVNSFTQKNKGLYFASPLNFRTVRVTSYSQLEQIMNGHYTDPTTGKTTNVSFAFPNIDVSESCVWIATYDNDANKTGSKNVYLLFYDLKYYIGGANGYKEQFAQHHINYADIVIAENIENNSGFYTGEQKSKLGLAYRFKVKFSNMQVPIIAKKKFTYDDWYLIATVDGFDRDLIAERMFLNSELYKKRLYSNKNEKDTKSLLLLKDIKKGSDDEETVKNIMKATWYSYDENYVYHCDDSCSGCHNKKEETNADTGEKTTTWELIDNTKKENTPGKGQHSINTKFCTGTSDYCPYCNAGVEKWFSLNLFGWKIDLGSIKKAKVRNPEVEKEKCVEINESTGEAETKQKTYTVETKINWFLENILKCVENSKSLRTVAANSTSDVAIVAKAMQFQGYIGGDKFLKFMGIDKYDNYKIWNAAFISYCANKCEISTSIIPKTYSINDFKNISSAKIKYAAVNSLQNLKTGDIVYINDPSIVKFTKAKYPSIEKEQASSEANGIALVVSVDTTNNKVNVIEGCTIAKDVAFKQYYYGGVKDPRSTSKPPSNLTTGGIVSIKQYNLSQITGYTRPAYEEPKGSVQIAVSLIKENIGSSVSLDYVNFNSANQLVIGYYKWTGNDAFKLLKRIYNMDANAFLNKLRDNGLEKSQFHKLITDIKDADQRNNFGAGLSAGTKTTIKKVCKEVLQSPSGLVVSESQKLYDVAKYMEKVKNVYHDPVTKILLTDFMFSKKNPILLETDDWAKKYQTFYASKSPKTPTDAIKVAKQYFVTDAQKNEVPGDISARAKKDLDYLSTLPSDRFEED